MEMFTDFKKFAGVKFFHAKKVCYLRNGVLTYVKTERFVDFISFQEKIKGLIERRGLKEVYIYSIENIFGDDFHLLEAYNNGEEPIVTDSDR